MNGFELCEKILELDVNIRVCFMSALEVNIWALREVYRNVGFGCFIENLKSFLLVTVAIIMTI